MASRPEEGVPAATAQEEIPTVPPPAPPPDGHVPEMQGQGVHAKALRIRAFWSEIGRTPGCPTCETPSPGKSHTRECKTYQDAWDESRRTASAEEAKRGVVADSDTRPLDLSGSSTDPEPKRTKTTSATDDENPADQMDEDNFRRGPPTSHQLKPADAVCPYQLSCSSLFLVCILSLPQDPSWPGCIIVNKSVTADGSLLSPTGGVKGMYPAPHIHEHFTIHKWLLQTAYIFTHNFNNLEHIATNCMNTTMHTDVNTA